MTSFPSSALLKIGALAQVLASFFWYSCRLKCWLLSSVVIAGMVFASGRDAQRRWGLRLGVLRDEDELSESGIADDRRIGSSVGFFLLF